ncbi:MAG: DUF2961 domain-containing protein [Gammaproteobacteria bacterium]|nr:DUF2961 domain-containing protein [Gammaproteobacteria bacterium]
MHELYRIPSHLRSRSISFENPRGEPGAGGQAASPLGQGRKGAPARMIAPGDTVELANIEGPGVIRHIWLATYDIADTMRGLVISAWWDGQSHPSIEAPLGDFFGFAHGHSPAYSSAVHSVGEKLALNIWLPMPFVSQARMCLRNDLDVPMLVFFQIDYTLGDELPEDVGRLHALFRREISTTPGQDYEVLPARRGRGRYLGAVIGVRPTSAHWWGEGEAKIYLDGDEAWPTIAGTGAEDYVCLSWGLQRNAYAYHGASLVSRERTDTGPVSMYRWHLPDPVFWQESIRVTVQQIGIEVDLQDPPTSLEGYKGSLRERQDDWSSCAFWYEAIPSAPLPALPDLDTRLHDLPRHPDLNTLPLQPGFSLKDVL